MLLFRESKRQLEKMLQEWVRWHRTLFPSEVCSLISRDHPCHLNSSEYCHCIQDVSYLKSTPCKLQTLCSMLQVAETAAIPVLSGTLEFTPFLLATSGDTVALAWVDKPSGALSPHKSKLGFNQSYEMVSVMERVSVMMALLSTCSSCPSGWQHLTSSEQSEGIDVFTLLPARMADRTDVHVHAGGRCA